MESLHKNSKRIQKTDAFMNALNTADTIVGGLVEHCHSLKSVDTVKRIVEAFKEGEKDFAEFWKFLKTSRVSVNSMAFIKLG